MAKSIREIEQILKRTNIIGGEKVARMTRKVKRISGDENLIFVRDIDNLKTSKAIEVETLGGTYTLKE